MVRLVQTVNLDKGYTKRLLLAMTLKKSRLNKLNNYKLWNASNTKYYMYNTNSLIYF